MSFANMSIREILNPRRNLVRSPPNPYDKATVVSILPLDIDETKVTLQPNRFKIKAGTFEKPSVLVVGTAAWWREVGEDEPLLEIPVAATLLADSIVRDYANGLLCCNMGDRMPGLFFVPGEKTVEAIKKDCTDQLMLAQAKQKAWFGELIRQADILWARTNGNPLAVDNIMRLAADQLGLRDQKPWMANFAAVSMVNCVACGHMRNPAYPVCPHCNTIVDVEAYKKMGLSAQKVG